MTQGEIEIVIALTSHFICVKLELLQKHTQMVNGSKIKKIPTLVQSATMTQRNSFNLETAPLKLAVIYSRCDAPLRGG